MNIIRKTLLFAACAFGALATAQTAPPLPNALSGRWTFFGPTAVLTDTVSLVFDGNGAPGPVAGKITIRGVTCGAKDEPFTGTWDGSVLRFEALMRADVNTTRMGGDCSAPAKIVLTRKPGQTAFEGETTRAGFTSRLQLAP